MQLNVVNVAIGMCLSISIVSLIFAFLNASAKLETHIFQAELDQRRLQLAMKDQSKREAVIADWHALKSANVHQAHISGVYAKLTELAAAKPANDRWTNVTIEPSKAVIHAEVMNPEHMRRNFENQSFVSAAKIEKVEPLTKEPDSFSVTYNVTFKSLDAP